jgi:GT2 family glycosyltransferase
MKKILFTIPTLFHNTDLVINCIDSLRENLKKFNVNYEICVVINKLNDSFIHYDFGSDVTKLCSNLEFNISKALNTSIQNITDFDYFCYIDEGVTIEHNYWIDYILELFENNPSIGLVGCRPHTTFNNYNKPLCDDPELYEVLWSDGILFTTKNILTKFNGFDEDFFGDCELQDFGYRLHFSNYINIYWKNLAKHKLIDYREKSSKPEQLIELANQSRLLFKRRWNSIELQNYNFESTPS